MSKEENRGGAVVTALGIRLGFARDAGYSANVAKHVHSQRVWQNQLATWQPEWHTSDVPLAAVLCHAQPFTLADSPNEAGVCCGKRQEPLHSRHPAYFAPARRNSPEQLRRPSLTAECLSVVHPDAHFRHHA